MSAIQLTEDDKPYYQARTLSSKRTPLHFLIDGVMLMASLVMIIGPPGSGKTNLVLEMIRAITTGTPFLGKYQVPEPRRVGLFEQDALIEDPENFLKGLYLSQQVSEKGDYARDEEGAGIWPEEAQERFRSYADLDIDLTKLDCVRAIIGTIQRDHLDVIVLDSFASLHSADENSNKEIGVVLRALKLIRAATGATIILIHHTNKQSGNKQRGVTVADINKARGGNSIVATTDAIFDVTIEGNDPAGTRLVRNIRTRRISVDPFCFSIAKQTDGYGNDIASITHEESVAEMKSNPSLDRVRALFASGKELSVKDVAEQAALPERTARKYVKTLLEEELCIAEARRVGQTTIYASNNLDRLAGKQGANGAGGHFTA